MNAKRQKFVAEYLKDLNATQAAIRAGYTKKNAKQAGSELLSFPDVKAAVRKGQAKHSQKAELTAVRVLEELRRLAFNDIRGLFDATGRLKDMASLTEEQAASLALEVVRTKSGSRLKFKAIDKTKALELLAKHFSLLVERTEVTGPEGGPIVFKWQS